MEIDHRQQIVGLTVEGPRQIGYRGFDVTQIPSGYFAADITHSAISPGTEMVAYLGGADTYPVKKIGYANTAVVTRTNFSSPLLQEGDRISMNVGHRTGDIEEFDGRERYKSKDSPLGRDSKDRWIKLPDDIDDELGTLAVQMLPIALMGALTAADQHPGGKVTTLEDSLKGQRAVIFGAGPIGLLAGEALRYAGADDVMIVDLAESRLDRAKALGMTTLNPRSDDPVNAIRERYSEPLVEHGENYGIGADIIINLAPNGIALNNAHRALHDQGVVIDMAYYAEPVLVDKGGRFHHGGLIDRSGQIGQTPRHQRPEWSRRRLGGTAIEILQDRGDVIKSAVISDYAELADAPDVFEDYAARNPLRLVTVFTQGDVSKLPVQPWESPTQAA